MEQLFGGNPAMVILRLVIISIIVGVILAALGLDAFDIVSSLQSLIQRIYDLGFRAFDKVFAYLLLGGAVVVPIWLIGRTLKVFSGGNKDKNQD